MTKNEIISVLSDVDDFVWDLYFLNINKKRKNPYVVDNVKFKSTDNLNKYAKDLLDSVIKFQVEPISGVQVYNGENPKVTCDTLSLESHLINQNWKLFYNAVSEAGTGKIKGKIHGYFLTGRNPNDEGGKSITLFKCANPVLQFSKNKIAVYRFIRNDELDSIQDVFCRLYLSSDFIIYDNTLYSFNCNFEKIFDMDKTIAKIRENCMNTISNLDVFSNNSDFIKHGKEYKSSRTFIALNPKRIAGIKDNKQRKKIAKMLDIALDENGKFIVDDDVKAAKLIKYICYKIFQEADTKDVLEASSITKISQ